VKQARFANQSARQGPARARGLVGKSRLFHLRSSRYFADPRVGPVLDQFTKDLQAVEEEITRRNQSRKPYEFLLPSRIPQSINV